MIIYKITNKINGKNYIGQTQQSLNRRWKDHIKRSKGKKGYAISNAISKYGKDNFDICIIDECVSIEDMNKKEIEYIAQYDSLYPKGYNLTTGGKNGNHSEITKRKLSEINKNTTPPSRLGSKISKEHKKVISEKLSERTRSKETVEKWKKSTKKTNNKAVVCINHYRIFNSLTKAAEYYGFSVSSIWRVVSNKKTSHKGLIFKYLEQ